MRKTNVCLAAAGIDGWKENGNELENETSWLELNGKVLSHRFLIGDFCFNSYVGISDFVTFLRVKKQQFRLIS